MAPTHPRNAPFPLTLLHYTLPLLPPPLHFPPLTPPPPVLFFTCRHMPARGVRRISGSWKGMSSSNFWRGKRCQHLPGCTRPARPVGWFEGWVWVLG
jgi:hypothetical protein